MEEYEVRDVSRRLIAPDLFIALRLNETPSGDLRQLSVQLIVGNNSPAPADFCLLNYFKDRHCQATCHVGADNSVEYSGSVIPVCSHEVQWRGHLRLPIWETARFNLETFSVSVRTDVDEVYFFWEALAPMMSRKTGVAVLTVKNDTVTVSNLPGEWKLQKEIIHGA
jgi:hypothetical protein